MRISIDLKNCHGIGEMHEAIDFKEDKPIVIHASNGVMKTSFTNTISDLIANIPSKDLIDETKLSVRDIKIDGVPATSDSFYIFGKPDANKLDVYVSAALMNPKLRDKYNTCLIDEKNKLNAFLKHYSQVTGQKEADLEMYFNNMTSNNNIHASLIKIKNIISRTKNFTSYDFKYNDVFKDQIKKFAKTSEAQKAISDYRKNYVKIMKKSNIFTSGIFDISSLLSIRDPLKSAKFFEGENKIIFKNNQIVSTYEELQKIIDEELSRINETEEAKNAFKDLTEKFIEKANLSKLAEKIKQNPNFTFIFTDMEKAEKKYMIQKANECLSELNEYLAEYKLAKHTVRSIFQEAQKEKKLWDQILDTFNARFRMPFTLSIKNIKNAVLDLNGMYVEFNFNGTPVKEEKLVNYILSDGEKRALYLLEMIFVIEKMEKDNHHPILIFDDIADSFDYTNKHAIIEYLHDISTSFRMIVFTHNFDFYRHFGYKASIRQNCYFANKDPISSTISLQNGEYLKNVFEAVFQNNIGKNRYKYDLAAIPFSRGVIELTKGEDSNDSNYMFFTYLLHYRPSKGSRCKMKKLYSVYKKIYPKQNINPSVLVSNDTVYKILLQEADLISRETEIKQNLTDKIILAIALRLCCEKYMYVKLKSKKLITSVDMDSLQIGELYHKKYKPNYPLDKFNKSIESTCLLVPQIIHLNGFMYEPLIDFSIDRLRNLFSEVYNKTHKLF